MDQENSASSSDSADEEFWDLANSSSDKDLMNLQIEALQEKGRRRRRGSIPGRINKDRQRLQGHETLFKECMCVLKLQAEIEKVKKRREERALEKAQHEEEMALLARERARAEFQDWEKKEEETHCWELRIYSLSIQKR